MVNIHFKNDISRSWSSKYKVLSELYEIRIKKKKLYEIHNLDRDDIILKGILPLTI